MTEDELRDLAGYGGPAEITFAGQRFKLRDDLLAPLLRYALAGMKAEPEGGGAGALAAMHQMMEGCVADFTAFSDAALAAKADLEEVHAAAKAVIELACARGYWPAIRLLGYIAASLEEIDGQLLRSTGRGLTALTAREACNLALAICLDGRDEDSRQEFYDDLTYEGSPDAEAMAALREYQAAQRQMGNGSG